MKGRVRFVYFHDPLTPRVVTVAARFTEKKGELEFSYCANLVEVLRRHLFSVHEGRYKWFCRVVDPFRKDRAKQICRGRLEKHPIRIQVPDGTSRIEAIVSYFETAPKNPEDERHVPNAVVSTVRRARKERLGEQVATLIS